MAEWTGLFNADESNLVSEKIHALTRRVADGNSSIGAFSLKAGCEPFEGIKNAIPAAFKVFVGRFLCITVMTVELLAPGVASRCTVWSDIPDRILRVLKGSFWRVG